MYHPTSKRRQIIIRTLVYAFMTLSVLTIVAVLMLVILGYSFNRQDGRLEQGGLLQFASAPSGATVTIDGVQTASRTPSKASVDAKSHHVRMDLKNYRSWQKTIEVQPGGIGWLSYARFVPNEVETENMRTFPQVATSLASEDRKWLVVQEDVVSPTLTFINIESDSPKYTDLTVPNAILTPATTPAPQSFAVQSWSRDDDKLLIKRMYDSDKFEWIVFDRSSPVDSINLTVSFGINALDAKFGERSGSNAYILTDDSTIRRVNFGDMTLSGPLVEDVEEYSVYENNTILYVTKPNGETNNQRHVGYREDSMRSAQPIFSYPADTANVHVAFGEYYGKNYVSVTHGTTLQIFSGTLPKGTTKSNLKEVQKVELTAAPIRLTIGDNGRFVVAQTADGYTTYDIELKKTDTTAFTKPTSVVRPLQWLDEYLIVDDREGMARFYEFDGSNQQDVMPVVEGQAMSFSGNDKYLYGFTKAEDGTISFTRALMVVSN